MKVKSRIILTAVFSFCIIALSNQTKAQQKEARDYAAQAGSSAIGFVFNPVSGIRANSMFKAGDFIGNAIAAQGSSPYQMFILADPMISLRYKYKITNVTAFRATVGFSGAKFNYKEYIQDDILFKEDPLSVEQVEDIIHFKMIGGGINLGLEFTGGTRNLRFVGGVGIVYSFGGGKMKFDYGNVMDDENPLPSTMPIIMDSLGSSGMYYDVNLASARPLKRYNVGVEHAFGLSFDAGIEWFFAKNLSIGASVSFIPFIFAIQPETYTDFEGYSVEDDGVLNFTKKISSGSNYLLYGTENIGLMLSFNYYLK